MSKKQEDKRLESEKFRQKVRAVLADFGLPNKMSNFRKLDALSINWESQFQSIQNPRQIAVVHPIDKSRGPCDKTFAMSVPGRTKKEAMANMPKMMEMMKKKKESE